MSFVSTMATTKAAAAAAEVAEGDYEVRISVLAPQPRLALLLVLLSSILEQ